MIMKQCCRSCLFFVILLWFAGHGGVYARQKEQTKVDSLLKELPHQKEDSNKVNLLSALAYYYYLIDPDAGIKYGLQGLELAEKIEFKRVDWLCNNIASDYKMKPDYPNALNYFFKEITIAEELNDSVCFADAYYSVGDTYYYLGDFAKALEVNFKALKLYERIGDKDRIGDLFNNIAVDYQKQSPPHYPEALSWFYKCIKINNEIDNESSIALAYSGIAEVYMSEHNYAAASNYLDTSLKIAEKCGDGHTKAWDLCDFGICYLSMVEDTSFKYPHNGIIPMGRNALLHAAIHYLERALDTSFILHKIDVIQLCYKHLAEAYKLAGDYKNSLAAFENYTINKDSIFSRGNHDTIIKMEMDLKYEQATMETQKKAELRLQKQRNLSYMGLAGVIMLLGFSFFIVKERRKSEKLLLNILPSEVANELKAKGRSDAKLFDHVTVMFTDFVNFTQAGEHMSPNELVNELHTCFKNFDEITRKYGIEKIKTIGDAYLAVAGLPSPDPLHAENVVRAAKEINAFMQDRVAKHGNSTFQIRIGVHSGSVVAGIVGINKFAYDIWGDTVNTAARMEQNSEAGKINISQTTYDLVKGQIACTYRGEIDAKGKGQLKMYYVG